MTTVPRVPKTKTISGFDIRIDAFLKVDVTSIDDQMAATVAVKAAMDGEPGALVALLEKCQDITAAHKYNNRRVPIVVLPPAIDPNGPPLPLDPPQGDAIATGPEFLDVESSHAPVTGEPSEDSGPHKRRK